MTGGKDRRVGRKMDDLPLGSARPRKSAATRAGSARDGSTAAKNAASSTRRKGEKSKGLRAQGKGSASTDPRMRARGQAIRRRRWMLPAVSVVVLLVAALATYAIWFSSWLAVRDVRVDGLDPAMATQVRTGARVEMGVPMARTDTEAIAQRVLQDKRVRTVEVSRRWPSTIVIAADRRTPALAVKNPQGKVEVADRSGVIFPAPAAAVKGLPVLSMKGGAPSQDRLEFVVPTLEALAPEQRRAVTGLVMDADGRLELVLGDVRVRWGDNSRTQEKSAALQALMRTSEARTKNVVIDVSAPDAPAMQAPHAPVPKPSSPQ